MNLPFALLAGLVVAMAHQEAATALPGSGDPWRVAVAAFATLVPMALALTALRLVRRHLLTGVVPVLPPRALLRLSAVATPLAVHALYEFGTYGDCLERWCWNDPGLAVLLAAVPAFAAELLRLAPATLASLLDEVAMDRLGATVAPWQLPTWAELRPILRLRLGWPLLLTMPIGVLAVLMQVGSWSRELHVVVLVTAPGVLVGALAFVLVSVLLLPMTFRAAFALDALLPEPTGARLRAVAERLGFSASRVLRLPTGGRSLNAMMVGPLPFGRFLCLTDGILRGLETEALAGVVAHEAGHARRGHPALLLLLALSMSMLALSPRFVLGWQELDWAWQITSAAFVVGVGYWLVRALAIHFEFEADAASVAALGAAPCSAALRAVLHLAQPMRQGWFGRLTSLHPDEDARFTHMRRYETEPVYRAAFAARGRRVRRALVAWVLTALGIVVWSWQRDHARERVLVDLLCGNVVAARAAAAELGDAPIGWRERWPQVLAELEVATAVAPAARDWITARDAYRSAWSRGEQVLLAKGPAMARPWLSLALGASDAPDDVQRAVHAYCRAADDQDPERMEQLKLLVQRLGVPPTLRSVFAD